MPKPDRGPEQRRKRRPKKAADALEAGHLRDAPRALGAMPLCGPLSEMPPAKPLSALPEPDLKA